MTPKWHFRLIGEFNAYNLLAVYGAAVCLGEDKDKVLQVLSNLDEPKEDSTTGSVNG